MLVTVVFAITAAGQPDHSRIEKVEDWPEEVARKMVDTGEARIPSEDELAEYEESRAVEDKANDAGDLTKMRKADLLKLADERGVDGTDESMTKAAIVGTIEAHQSSQTSTAPNPNVPFGDLSVGLPTDMGGAAPNDGDASTPGE